MARFRRRGRERPRSCPQRGRAASVEGPRSSGVRQGVYRRGNGGNHARRRFHGFDSRFRLHRGDKTGRGKLGGKNDDERRKNTKNAPLCPLIPKTGIFSLNAFIQGFVMDAFPDNHLLQKGFARTSIVMLRKLQNSSKPALDGGPKAACGAWRRHHGRDFASFVVCLLPAGRQRLPPRRRKRKPTPGGPHFVVAG